MVVAWSVIKYSLVWSRCLLLGKLTWIVTRFKLCFIICPKLVLDLKRITPGFNYQIYADRGKRSWWKNAYCISREKQCLHIVLETLMTPWILCEILTFTLCYKFGSKNSVKCFWFSFVNISVRGPWTRLIWLPTILHLITSHEPYRFGNAPIQITY